MDEYGQRMKPSRRVILLELWRSYNIPIVIGSVLIFVEIFLSINREYMGYATESDFHFHVLEALRIQKGEALARIIHGRPGNGLASVA